MVAKTPAILAATFLSGAVLILLVPSSDAAVVDTTWPVDTPCQLINPHGSNPLYGFDCTVGVCHVYALDYDYDNPIIGSHPGIPYVHNVGVWCPL